MGPGYKQPNLYSDFQAGGERIMGVVFNDKFMSRARVVSRSDYTRCRKCPALPLALSIGNFLPEVLAPYA